MKKFKQVILFLLILSLFLVLSIFTMKKYADIFHNITVFFFAFFMAEKIMDLTKWILNK